MPVDFARKLISLRADSELLADFESLHEKANLGTLTIDEDEIYKEFVDAVDVISVLQAKARHVLERQAL